ncbi:MAG: TIGR01777 family oxidoreductase [Acidimicrobiia bacterium]
MKVAITGSHGLIGSALATSLTAEGHQVLPVVRPGSPRNGHGSVTWDVEAGTIDAAALEGVDAVVNLAGAGIGDRRLTDERKQLVVDSRIDGTTLLSQALAGLDQPPRALVSGSAIGYYGDRGDEVLTESSVPQPGNFLSDLCVGWEQATAAAGAAGIRVAHLRSAMVLSAKGGALAKMLPVFKLGAGAKMGAGRQWWSWVSIDDEVAAIRFLLNNDIAGPVNLSAPEPVTNAEFTKALGKVLHRPTKLPVPSFGPRLLLGGDRADMLLFTSARVLPEKLEASGFKFRHGDVESAFRAATSRT